MVASPHSPSFGGIPKSYSVPPHVASEEKGKSNKGLGGMEPSQFGMPSSLPLVHLHRTLVAEPGGTNKVPVLVRDRGSLTREGKLCWKVWLHPDLEQAVARLVEGSLGRVCHFFSLSQMRANSSRTTPLKCFFFFFLIGTGLIPRA